MKKYRWGIIGPGAIAHKFANALLLSHKSEIKAVLSRTWERANQFAELYKIERIFTDNDDFIQNSDIDIAYIATPHNYHLPFVKMCLENGIHVVCEKPAGINHSQVAEMVQLAKQNKLFFMEAMWTQFLPTMRQIIRIVQEGKLGDVRFVDAKFCFKGEYNPQGRLLNPQLAGGALLDVGVYPLYFAQMIYGKYPTQIVGAAHIGKTGVDESSSYILRYENGEMAVLSAAVQTHTLHDGNIYGTEGYMKIPDFWHPSSFTINIKGNEEFFRIEQEQNGFVYEIEEVHRCLDAGELESAIVSPRKSLEIAQIMDTLRSQWGLRYPSEMENAQFQISTLES